MNEINFNVEDIEKIDLSMDVGIKEIYPLLENLEITPTKEQQVFTHENSYGYDKVIVEAVPETKLQDKEVTPTKETQNITSDANYDGLNQVTVNPIPDEYIIPSGTLDINANGETDVTMFRMARIGVHTPPTLQDKSISITENGTQTITADDGYDGLSSVEINTEFSASKYAPRYLRFTMYPYTEMDYESINLDTSNMTIMDHMFSSTKLTSLDISNWNTSNVTSMSNTFYGNNKLVTLNLGEIDTSNVTNMTQLFTMCSSLTTLDVSHFNTSKVTLMNGMFKQVSVTELNLENFDTSSVTLMNDMFYNCSYLENLNVKNFNTSTVTNMSSMFYGCKKLTELDLSHFDVSKVTSMTTMFYGCSTLTSLNLSNWQISKATSLMDMFYDCTALTELDLSTWSTPLVTSIRNMFRNCKALKKLNLSGMDTSKVTNSTYVFAYCSALETLIIDNPVMFKIKSTDSFTSSGIATGICTIYVPDDMVATYQADTYWGVYSSQIKGMSEYTG